MRCGKLKLGVWEFRYFAESWIADVSYVLFRDGRTRNSMQRRAWDIVSRISRIAEHQDKKLESQEVSEG